MKKSLIFLFSFFSYMANANTEKSNLEQALLDQIPQMVLAVQDMSTQPPKIIEKLEISRSNPNQYLCWRAVNTGAYTPNLVIEQFTSPMVMQFVDAQGTQAQREKSGKVHIFTSRAASINDQFVAKCWQFTQKHPRGEYSLAVRINNIEFPVQKFKVVK